MAEPMCDSNVGILDPQELCERKCLLEKESGFCRLVMIVQFDKSWWDVITLTPTSAKSWHRSTRLSNQRTHDHLEDNVEQSMDIFASMCNSGVIKRKKSEENGTSVRNVGFLSYAMEVLYFCVFLKELQCSSTYRYLFVNHLLKCLQNKSHRLSGSTVVRWRLGDNLPQVIDHEWNERMTRSALERQHLDTAMSWLSTLGGACSALGDYDLQFAKRAGSISFQQMDVAQRIGDPGIVARCRLYIAISLIQQCRFKIAAVIIRHEYYWAHSFPSEARDRRLINMCHGIWAKLQHEKKAAVLSNVQKSKHGSKSGCSN